MPRRMRDPEFRADQFARLHEPHIAPITDFTDDLVEHGGRGWMPYLAPMYGGVAARVLSIFRDPGPKAHEQGGSGFLCVENDDPSAERYATLLEEAGLPVRELLPWNAYPWYINRKPTTAELDAAAEPLRRLIGLLPRLRVVLLHGGDAQQGWRRFARRYPDVANRRDLAVIKTYHTSRQAFWHPDPTVRNQRLAKLRIDLAHAAALLRKDDARIAS
jgi:hypothetical protein